MKKLDLKKYMFAGWFGITNPFGSSSFSTMTGTAGKIVTVINLAINASALVAVGLIIYGGILMITSAGDDEKIEKGSKTLTAAIIGMIIVFLAKLILTFVIEKILV